MKDRSCPIGIFDSGIGGLTVFKAIRQLLPNENLIYFGDTARVPYGTKSREAIISYSREISQYLLQKKVKMLVIACNTATSMALEEVRKISGVPVCGVIEPGARAAIKATPENGRILVIGTKATVSSRAYSKALLGIRKDICVWEQSCPLFVPLVEEGWTEKKITEEAAREYLGGYADKNINALILGCTHYPLLENAVRRVMGGSVIIVNSALAAACHVKDVLQNEELLSCNTQNGTDSFIVSDDQAHFSMMAKKLLGIRAGNVQTKRF